MPQPITQAILPVAGLGTRFLPWTKAVPKELLPIGNQPIIALLVDEVLSIGIREICFVISKGKEAIPEYFFEHPELRAELAKRGKAHMLEELARYSELSFHVVYQDEQKGDGHAILQAKNWVRGDVTAVLFGDDIIEGPKSGLQQLQLGYEEAQKIVGDGIFPAVIALENVPREAVSKYGIADVEQSSGRLKRVKNLVEKPKPEIAPSTLGIVGKYLIPRSTFEILPTVGAGAGEIRLIGALIAGLPSTPVFGYEFEGKRYDTGTPEGYREAVQALG